MDIFDSFIHIVFFIAFTIIYSLVFRLGQRHEDRLDKLDEDFEKLRTELSKNSQEAN